MGFEQEYWCDKVLVLKDVKRGDYQVANTLLRITFMAFIVKETYNKICEHNQHWCAKGVVFAQSYIWLYKISKCFWWAFFGGWSSFRGWGICRFHCTQIFDAHWPGHITSLGYRGRNMVSQSMTRIPYSAEYTLPAQRRTLSWTQEGPEEQHRCFLAISARFDPFSPIFEGPFYHNIGVSCQKNKRHGRKQSATAWCTTAEWGLEALCNSVSIGIALLPSHALSRECTGTVMSCQKDLGCICLSKSIYSAL